MRSALISIVVALGIVGAAYAEITVESVGTTRVKPDTGCVTMFVSQRGVDAAKLEATLRQRAQELADKLSKLEGVRRCDVKRADLSLERSVMYDGNVPAPKIFRGTYAVVVLAAPEEKLMLNVVRVGVDSGAEMTAEQAHYAEERVTYGVSKADGAYSDAFADALRKARSRAKHVADQSGLKLGGLKTVVEGSACEPRYVMMEDLRLYGVEFAGPDPSTVQLSVRFWITFDTK